MRISVALLVFSAFYSAGCAAVADDYFADPTLSERDRAFAECSVVANEMAARYLGPGVAGGLASLAASKQTLDDCMTAQGFSRD